MWGCSCGQLQHSSSFIWAGDAWLTAHKFIPCIWSQQSDALCAENMLQNFWTDKTNVILVLLDMNVDVQNAISSSS